MRKFNKPLIILAFICALGLIGSVAAYSGSRDFQLVHIVNYRFIPSTITINPGDMLIWTNEDKFGFGAIQDVAILDPSCRVVDVFFLVTGERNCATFLCPGEYTMVLGQNPRRVGHIIVRNPCPVP